MLYFVRLAAQTAISDDRILKCSYDCFDAPLFIHFLHSSTLFHEVALQLQQLAIASIAIEMCQPASVPYVPAQIAPSQLWGFSINSLLAD